MNTVGSPTAFLRLSVWCLLGSIVVANGARAQDTTAQGTTPRDTTVRDTTTQDTIARDTPTVPAAVTDTTLTVVDSAEGRSSPADTDTAETASTPAGVDTSAARTAGTDSAGVQASDADTSAVRATADSVAEAGPVIPSSPALDTLSNEVFQRTLRAYLVVRDLRSAFRARYGTAGTRAADDTTYQAFQREAKRAIQSTGLAEETYRALLATAQTDTLLRGVLLRGLGGMGDSASIPLDSLRPDSSWIAGASAPTERPADSGRAAVAGDSGAVAESGPGRPAATARSDTAAGGPVADPDTAGTRTPASSDTSAATDSGVPEGAPPGGGRAVSPDTSATSAPADTVRNVP